jgi:hypothetical protein
MMKLLVMTFNIERLIYRAISFLYIICDYFYNEAYILVKHNQIKNLFNKDVL